MKDECLICKAPLEYLIKDTEMECVICHKKTQSKTRCINGHYVCDECHIQGADNIWQICMHEKSKNPVEIIEKLMRIPNCHMHGPEHHIMVGSALLTAYRNSGGKIDLGTALSEMKNRGSKVPGGACGFWGACGAAISSGMFISIVTGSTPLKMKEYGLSNLMTSHSLKAIGEIGGARCCKRNSFLAIKQAVSFVKENLGVEMEMGEIICSHSPMNNQCIGKRCPFNNINLKRINT